MKNKSAEKDVEQMIANGYPKDDCFRWLAFHNECEFKNNAPFFIVKLKTGGCKIIQALDLEDCKCRFFKEFPNSSYLWIADFKTKHIFQETT